MNADPPTSADAWPRAFFWRRLHSLTGVWLSLYLIVHLFTNSQAAFMLGEHGQGFIKAVNAIHELPFLYLIEIAFLAIPILIHLLWGIDYALRSRANSYGDSGHAPYLPEYTRNRAYTWQRITSWLLIVGIIAHVIHMRVIEYPFTVTNDMSKTYVVRVTNDAGLPALAKRLDVTLYDAANIQTAKAFDAHPNWVATLQKNPLKPNEVMATADNFGTVELLMVRDTFKMPLMLALYTIFVLAACFHGFNGLWTAMISWGITLTQRSQRIMRHISNFLMVVVAFLGLSAIWLTYWINLK